MFRIVTCWLLVLCILSGCETDAVRNDRELTHFSPEETDRMRSLLIGKWIGERTLDGRKVRWLSTKNPDGSDDTEFRVLEPDGQKTEWIEHSIWGVRKPIYFTAMRGFIEDGRVAPIDTSHPDAYDAYRIDVLDSGVFEYTSYTSGVSFTVTKVADDYEMAE